MAYTVGSLFAGIGGMDLGFERAGFKTVWQVEIDPYCQKVLTKNFPEARRYFDVRQCCGRTDCGYACGRSSHLSRVDVIAGGFPCQDISNAGLRAGIEGERSGLWSEMLRIICDLLPRFVLVENVAALLGRGMGRVLGDLAEVGYDAEWRIISAAELGAPHLRERVWVVAYPNGNDAQRIFAGGFDAEERAKQGKRSTGPCYAGAGRQWATEPHVGRVAHGIPARVDRLRALGNAVVPQIPEMIALRIREALEVA